MLRSLLERADAEAEAREAAARLISGWKVAAPTQQPKVKTESASFAFGKNNKEHYILCRHFSYADEWHTIVYAGCNYLLK